MPLGHRLARIVGAFLVGIVASTTVAQSPQKPRLAIRKIDATPAAMRQADAAGQANVLRQILEGSNSLLTTTIQRSGRFDIVAREDLAEIIKEQDLAESGNVDGSDPQAARPGRLAGAGYVATVTVDNFQDVVQRANFAGQFGEEASERRTIQIQATLKIFDSTTGTLKEPATITFERSALNDVLPGVQQQGRATNALIGTVTREFASEAANEILNRLAPAKVIAYTMGVATINRGEGTGIEPGQFWELFHAGEAMIDPDTGENLGSEEIPIGWAKVVSVQPRFSRIQVIQDFGIDRGTIARFVKEGPPADVDRNARAGGSAQSAAGTAPASATPPASGGPAGRSAVAAPPPGVSPDTIPGPAATEPVRLALFIQDVTPDVPDEKVEVLASLLAATLTSPEIEIISRDLVLNAVSRLAKVGANEGTGDPKNTEVERLLSDQTSAVALAANLGADGLVVATITSLDEDERKFNDPSIGVATNVVITTLDVTWRVLDGGTGASLASGIAESRDQIRNTANLQRSAASLDQLLKNAARQIGPKVQQAMRRDAGRRPTPRGDQLVDVQIWIEMQDLNVPEIREIDGEWTVTANRYNLAPLGCNVLVDGFLAGTAPGTIQMAPGPRRIRIERPGLEPVNQFMVARPGMQIRIPVQLSPEGRRRWMEQTSFFEELKNNAALRKGEEEKAAALADFLKQSRMTIDTSNLENLNVGGRSFWGQILEN
ncbi:MAG: CsgG/HfaB family protein [Planctomycetota bacterium]|jgi:curli biogenesis system outer membrane secretion channel CsgG